MTATPENGIVEQMVAGLMAEAAALGVRRVSLNFAVFRSVFARGERLGAGPVLRVWRSVLLSASRFWQIESLYRANAKYQPEWVPRFVCFRSSADLPRVSVAAPARRGVPGGPELGAALRPVLKRTASGGRGWPPAPRGTPSPRSPRDRSRDWGSHMV